MRLTEEMVGALTKALVDDGKLIEAGWLGLRLTAFGPGMPKAQVADFRDCFFAGAQHLMASVMTMLDPDEEPTDDDLKRMDSIDAELKNFFEDFKKRHNIQE